MDPEWTHALGEDALSRGHVDITEGSQRFCQWTLSPSECRSLCQAWALTGNKASWPFLLRLMGRPFQLKLIICKITKEMSQDLLPPPPRGLPCSLTSGLGSQLCHHISVLCCCTC